MKDESDPHAKLRAILASPDEERKSQAAQVILKRLADGQSPRSRLPLSLMVRQNVLVLAKKGKVLTTG